ncbi:MAG TPA: tripartite tricarboxylate transporter TctB family protein [Candidatus Acidoferrum sp.]|nr:tripartite tricarboxylate transporter TctB family protein [Candidatus Acidoferrum sp.]
MAHDIDPVVPPPARKRLVRAPRELAAGLCLVALATVALWSSADLEAGRLAAVGPGMLPRSVAVLLGLAGLGFAVVGFLKDGEALERWSLRGPLMVTLGVIGFALTIRTVGLALAGPVVVLVGGAASSEARVKELAIVAVVLTLFCIGLFRYALGLPIPILIVGQRVHL